MTELPDSPPGIWPQIVPGIAAFARGERPEPPAEDDSNEWVDGLCWLYCAEWGRVMWVGRVTVAGADAPLFACEPCIRRLNSLVWGYLYRADAGGARTQHSHAPVSDAGQSVPRSRSRHRRSVLGLIRRRTFHPDGR
ncbi:hypothetical protein [Kitasatospora sp. NRRL B-11411]|uniref:hypothetical protein n=1 Tax=Kitasatospora sp. NRRL B-11411 TaxID=1463822 RepID=UPI00068CF80D|nr:hypothetical protein [Kitasatospora sp. NRRL B-11411]